MNWRATRTVIIHLYAVGFLLLGIFVFYSALSGGQISGFWLEICASLLLVSEGIWTLLKKVEASCDRFLIAGGTDVEAEWEQGPAV